MSGPRPQTDDEPLITLYKKLIEYHLNLQKLDVLIQYSETPEEKEEYAHLKQDLEQAIKFQESTIHQHQKKEAFFYNPVPIREEEVGRVCKAFYKEHRKWYNALILSLEEDSQEAEVSFIGYKGVERVSTVFIKMMPLIEPALVQVGFLCECISSEDGRWRDCIIEKTSEAGVHVSFLHNNEKEIVHVSFLREKKQKNEQGSRSDLGKRTSNTENQGEPENDEDDGPKEFVVPEHLKVKPSDSEAERLRKRKKVKLMKFQFKQNLIEKVTSQRQNKWTSFTKNTKMRQGALGNKAKDTLSDEKQQINGANGLEDIPIGVSRPESSLGNRTSANFNSLFYSRQKQQMEKSSSVNFVPSFHDPMMLQMQIGGVPVNHNVISPYINNQPLSQLPTAIHQPQPFQRAGFTNQPVSGAESWPNSQNGTGVVASGTSLRKPNDPSQSGATGSTSRSSRFRFSG